MRPVQQSSEVVGIDPKATGDLEKMGITSWESRDKLITISWGQNWLKLSNVGELVQLGSNSCQMVTCVVEVPTLCFTVYK